MIEKSLLLKDFPSVTLFFDLNATTKSYFAINFLSTASKKRWNYVNLGYFDFYFNRAYSEDEIVLMRKNVYDKNVIFFV